MYLLALTLQSTANPWLMFIFSKQVREHTVHLLKCRSNAKVQGSFDTQRQKYFISKRDQNEKGGKVNEEGLGKNDLIVISFSLLFP